MVSPEPDTLDTPDLMPPAVAAFVRGELASVQMHAAATPISTWLNARMTEISIACQRDPRFADWLALAHELPPQPEEQLIADAVVALKPTRPLDSATHEIARRVLMGLRPWRKGPFDYAGISIDAEWRSDLKWQRLLDGGLHLDGERVLDVGCGNGYYAWRMLAAGARFVLGIDPGLRHLAQYAAFKRSFRQYPVALLPLTDESLGSLVAAFDRVFSMGVLYHRRDAVAHLKRLHQVLDAGGRLVLETLVLDDADECELNPEGRYAKMRNVWAVPSLLRLRRWLQHAGFDSIECVDVSLTTISEQRRTAWIESQSLDSFLDPADTTKTIEGYPAPRRAIVFARRE